MACSYCKTNFYIKTIQYTAPVLAPLTHVQELQDRVTDLTGEVYLRIETNFCPMCGENLMKGQTNV